MAIEIAVKVSLDGPKALKTRLFASKTIPGFHSKK